MSKRLRKKKITQERASPVPLSTPQYAPGGATMYVPPSYTQSILGQTYYGTTLKNSPAQWTSLFSPGVPLPPQPTVNAEGLPVQWRFPIGYNTFPVDRTVGRQDVPSFEELRRLAMLDYGIGMCERYWLDMVPKMTLNIKLTQDAIAGGAEEKNYQKEIKYFKNWFSKPDGKIDIHTWLRTALINQSRYDDLYYYKNKTRGGKLLALEIVDPSQMKPLLDLWGRIPEPPKYAYQQYPWGIPGWQYTEEQIIHYRESPQSDTPYGFSRIERIITMTNLALRKIKQDLAHYTEGNIPAGMLMPPESSGWTPDQLDAYEQSWNALIAGNLQQLARIKVVQPGFEYTPFIQPSFDSVFDRFMLTVRAGAYGITMEALGFTDTSNRSTGETQQDLLYSRTIGPLAIIYSMHLTDCMQNDFEPSLHGDMFEITFGGYEEKEDKKTKADTTKTYTGAGVLGLTLAAKLDGLPEEPDAPHIGRVLMTPNGPLFLDNKEFMDAWLEAQIAGFQMATNPPIQEQGNETGSTQPNDKSQLPQQQSKKKISQGSMEDGKKPSKQRTIANDLRLHEENKLPIPGDVTPQDIIEMIYGEQDETIQEKEAPQEETVEGKNTLSHVTPTPAHKGIPHVRAFAETSVSGGNTTVETNSLGVDINEQRAQQNTESKEKSPLHLTGGDRTTSTTTATTDSQQSRTERGIAEKAHSEDYRRWFTRAKEDVKANKPQRGFTTTIIPAFVHAHIAQGLERCISVDDVKAVFESARQLEMVGGTQ